MKRKLPFLECLNPVCKCPCHEKVSKKDEPKLYQMALINFKYHSADKEKVCIQTPTELFDQLNKEFRFDFDPCPLDYYERKKSGDNSVPDGLTCEWQKRNWLNPPFNEIKKWAIKAIEESKKGKLTVMLVPFRPQAKYWFEHIHPTNPEYRVIKGKVKFPGYQQGFPQCMVIVIIKPRLV